MTIEQPLTTRGLTRLIQGRAEETLPAEVATHPHLRGLRHAFATLALEAGASLRGCSTRRGTPTPARRRGTI